MEQTRERVDDLERKIGRTRILMVVLAIVMFWWTADRTADRNRDFDQAEILSGARMIIDACSLHAPPMEARHAGE